MLNNWEIEKRKIIKEYFSDKEAMHKIVEKACKGDVGCEKQLADWFEKNNYPDKAKEWRNREIIRMMINPAIKNSLI